MSQSKKCEVMGPGGPTFWQSPGDVDTKKMNINHLGKIQKQLTATHLMLGCYKTGLARRSGHGSRFAAVAGSGCPAARQLTLTTELEHRIKAFIGNVGMASLLADAEIGINVRY